MRILMTGAAICAACVATATADNWANWRGPDGSGVATGSKYPTHWSPSENIAWKVELPGRGGSTPVIWEDNIFVTYTADGQNGVLCLDREGNQRWDVALGDERAPKHKKASGANPSPATDGENVFVYYKSGDLACLDFAGNVVWKQNLQDMYGEDTLWWDLGTSPVLTRDLVVVACIQSGPSYLAGFAKRTGEVVWKYDRTLEAPEESAQSYSTPVVIRDGDTETIIVLGADHVTAHDAATGRELWRVGGLNPSGARFFRSIASPVVADGMVIAPYARGQSLTAIRLGGEGDVTDSHVSWTKTGISADVPTPAAVGGRVYVCTDRGEIACLNLDDGEVIWSDRVERHRTTFSASPIVADGKIYATREDGTTFVVEQGDQFKLLASNALDESTVSTPVFLDGRIYLRTYNHLYCIAQ